MSSSISFFQYFSILVKSMLHGREVVVGKVAAHLCLTLIVDELKIDVWHGNNIEYNQTLTIFFSIVVGQPI